MNEEEILNEAQRCLNCQIPRCKEACPLHTNIPNMISKVKEQKFKEANDISKLTNPLGAICGLICPHEKQCEGSCVRGIKERPVAIGKIENFVCEKAMNEKALDEIASEKDITPNNIASNSQPKVAIIGGGPAGISCAYFLSKNNISCTIFEKEKFLGRNFAVWNSKF